MAGETKKCEVCEQEIGSSEKVCPKCGTDFEELEEQVKNAGKVLTVLEKRRKASEPPPAEPQPQPKRKSIFASLTPKG